MDNKNIYYLLVKLADERDRHLSGLKNDLVLVIAETEDDALTLMKNFLLDHSIAATVSIPEDASIDVGHGMSVKEYLTDPQHRVQNWREVIDSYINHYNRYELQILDERGELLYQNDYTQEPNFILPFQPPKNKFVPIDIADIDKLDSGIAFVADESEKDSMGFILIAEKITNDDGTIIIKQTQILPDGSLNTRIYKDGVWSQFEHVYTEEAPEDNKYYMRINDTWKGFLFDNEPTVNSKELVNSGNIYDWVINKISKMYEVKGQIDLSNEHEANAILGRKDKKIGDTYNVIGEGTYEYSREKEFPYDMIVSQEVTASKSFKVSFTEAQKDWYNWFEVNDKITVHLSTDESVTSNFTVTNINYEDRSLTLTANEATAAGTYKVTSIHTSLIAHVGDNIVWTGYGWDNLSHYVDLSLYSLKAETPGYRVRDNDGNYEGEIFNDYENNTAFSNFTTTTGSINSNGAACKFEIDSVTDETVDYVTYKKLKLKPTTSPYVSKIKDAKVIFLLTDRLYYDRLEKELTDSFSFDETTLTLTFRNDNTNMWHNQIGFHSNYTHLVLALSGDSRGGNNSYLGGSENFLYAVNSVMFGNKNIALADNSDTFGYNNLNLSWCGHAEGWGNIVTNRRGHVEGNANISAGNSSHAQNLLNIVTGDYADAGGDHNVVKGTSSFARGSRNVVNGAAGIASGQGNELNGNQSMIAGQQNKEYGQYSFTGGFTNESHSFCSITWGQGLNVGLTEEINSKYNAIFGVANNVDGQSNLVGGYQHTITGSQNVVGGQLVKITSSNNNVAVGLQLSINNASNNAIFGNSNEIQEGCQGVLISGIRNVATASTQTVRGFSAKIDTEKRYLDIVGNGEWSENRSNAYTLSKDGIGWFAKEVRVGGDSDTADDCVKLADMKDLESYVKFTDIASDTKLGIVSTKDSYGIGVNNDGDLFIRRAQPAQIAERTDNYLPIVSSNLNDAVKASLTDANRIANLTDDEKKNARGVFDAISATDYATRDTGGTVIVRSENGVYIGSSGLLTTVSAKDEEIATRASLYKVITPSNLNTAVKATLLDDKKITFTDDETKTIRESLSAVGTTDYSTSTKAGVIKCNTGHGLVVNGDGLIYITHAVDSEITDRSTQYKPITPDNLNFAVKSALTDAKRITGLTEEEQQNARGVINAASNTELGKLSKNFEDHLLDYENILSPTGGILAQAKKYTDDNKYDDTAVKADIETNKDAIDKLNGTGEGSVTNTVNEAVAKVVGGAPESFDTLKEIADWIGDNPDGASAMNTAIKQNAEDIKKKQDKLTFDDAPTADSSNVLTSGTVASAIADFVKKTDYGTRTTPGIVSAQREYGIGIGGANSHLLTIQNAAEATITARTDQYHAITPNRLNFAVKSALSDANRISDMTATEKSNARGVINAEQAKTYQIATSTDTLATSILLEDKKVIQNIFGSITSLTITLPETINDSFESEFSFKCSSNFGSITYPINIIFRGVDCDKTGKFTPRASVRYEVSVRCVGTASNGNKVLVGRVGEF